MTKPSHVPPCEWESIAPRGPCPSPIPALGQPRSPELCPLVLSTSGTEVVPDPGHGMPRVLAPLWALERLRCAHCPAAALLTCSPGSCLGLAQDPGLQTEGGTGPVPRAASPRPASPAGGVWLCSAPVLGLQCGCQRDLSTLSQACLLLPSWGPS